MASYRRQVARKENNLFDTKASSMMTVKTVKAQMGENREKRACGDNKSPELIRVGG